MLSADSRKNYRNHLLTIFCLLGAALIGAIRYLTGPEFSLSLFYLLPIAVGTWYSGKWAGVMVSLTSAISWLIADLTMAATFSNPMVPYLNETFRLTGFLIITFILVKLKRAMENHKALA